MAQLLDEGVADASKYSRARDAVTARMPSLVKGASMAMPGGNTPLSDSREILTRAMEAEKALFRATMDGILNPVAVKAGLNPSFTQAHGLFLSQTPQSAAFNRYAENLESRLSQILGTDLGRNFSTTSPLASGFVPFDLLAPSRLIYPVYSPLRNKIQRVPGQGTSHRAKLITGVSGSQTGGAPIADISISEFPQGQGFGNWPLQLPGSGTQEAVDLNIPYKFFGMTESLSWLAQFEGQGFEDISALANMILLQQFMMAEEYQYLAATGTALANPTGVTVTSRAVQGNETAFVATGNVYALVTAVNYFGETTGSAVASAAVVSGDSYDVKWNAVNGAFAYNVYVAEGTSQPATTTFVLANTSGTIGGTAFTLQGAFPTDTTHPPTADTGTASTNRYEGIMSILDGHASVDASVYPSGFLGGYVAKNVRAVANHTTIFDALQGLFDGTGAYRADPAELIGEGGDIARLTEEIINSGSANTAYRLFVQQSELGQVVAGAAVSEFINPVTRSMLKVLVHPFLTQGSMFLFSYQLPMPWSNVSNVWENVLVQDYLSIAWPVIDLTFRYSLVMDGSLVCYAPQYNAVLGGLQRSVPGTGSLGYT